VEKRKE
jgi:hypothetical protein